MPISTFDSLSTWHDPRNVSVSSKYFHLLWFDRKFCRQFLIRGSHFRFQLQGLPKLIARDFFFSWNPSNRFVTLVDLTRNIVTKMKKTNLQLCMYHPKIEQSQGVYFWTLIHHETYSIFIQQKKYSEKHQRFDNGVKIRCIRTITVKTKATCINK